MAVRVLRRLKSYYKGLNTLIEIINFEIYLDQINLKTLIVLWIIFFVILWLFQINEKWDIKVNEAEKEIEND